MSIKLPKWLKNPRNVILLSVGLGTVLGIAIALATGTLKAGFGAGTTTVTSEKTDSQGKVIERTTTKTPQEAKTLWDWLSLAGVPLSLAGLGFWLQLQQQKQNDLQKERELRQTEELAAVEREQTKELAIIQREQTEKLATIEQDIAEQNRQEEALQNYYDKVSALLVDRNLVAIAAKGDTTTPEERELLDVAVDVIRARTLTTLRKLDSTRKTSLIRFLLESEVISKLEMGLAKANLEGADLRVANLSSANLYDADLRGANLSSANLYEADLMGANLSKANLYKANLEWANLWSANLSKANLSKANLSHANLRFALLEGANLDYAIGLTKEQLEGENPPFLCRTKLPEGIDIDPNRDCERLEKNLS